MIQEEEYASSSVQQLVKFVSETAVDVTNITKITAEISPIFTTYNLEVISSGKPYQVKVIDNNNVREVVSVHTTSQTTVTEQVTTIKVDQNGNQVT